MNDMDNSDDIAEASPNLAITCDETASTQSEEVIVPENEQVARPRLARANTALNQPLPSRQFAKVIATLDQPLPSRQFAKVIATLDQPLPSRQFARAIATLDQPVLQPKLAKAIAALNQPVPQPKLAKAIAALNQPVLQPKLAKAIAALNRQSAAFALPNIIGSGALRQQPNLLTMAVDVNRRFPWTYSLARPTMASGMHTLLESSREKLSGIDIGEPAFFEEHWLDLFDQMVTHKGLRQVCRDLFADGYFDIAVERAYIYVGNVVQAKSGLANKHGADLMWTAFSAKSPVLKLNSFQSDSEKNEQRGYMNIFAGSMMGIRNPRAHEHEFVDDPEVALELLVLANHLMRKLDGTVKD